MTFNGWSFFVPSILSFVAFITWILVLNRMTNLHIKRFSRYIILMWTFSMLALAIMDMTEDHVYPSWWRAFCVVFLKSVIRVGMIYVGCVHYNLLGKSYPIRMKKSPHEITP